MNKWSSVLVVLAVGCVEPYPAPDIGTGVSILVVDGFLNATENSATVKLTKAVPLAEQGGYPAEKGADVVIRSDGGDSFTLVEQDSGKYAAYGLTVEPTEKYQLIVRTRDNYEIVSEYVSVIRTPPIDSVTWRPDDEGVTIQVNTHDDSNNSRYYSWDFIETWEYHAPYPSPFRTLNGSLYMLPADQMPYYCYRTQPSTIITIGSTVKLTEDVIRDFPLTYMKAGSSRLSILYSTLVRQRVVSDVEFDFLQDLKRVTESVGGLFDSQPYEIVGNVHSSDQSVKVIGYFSAGYTDQKRLFLRYSELPGHLQKVEYSYCPIDTVCIIRRADRKCRIELAEMPDNSFLVADLSPSYPGYTFTIERCADCRFQGGVLTKPDFWP